MSAELDRLVAGLADAIAERVAARLVDEARSGVRGRTPDESEPWRLLNLAEAADRLGRSERWVRERVKRGELTHVRLDGGALAFDVDDLRSFARSRRVGPQLADAAGGQRLQAVGEEWWQT